MTYEFCKVERDGHLTTVTLDRVAAMFASEDFKEGQQAFAQKRAPKWSGR